MCVPISCRMNDVPHCFTIVVRALCGVGATYAAPPTLSGNFGRPPSGHSLLSPGHNNRDWEQFVRDSMKWSDLNFLAQADAGTYVPVLLAILAWGISNRVSSESARAQWRWLATTLIVSLVVLTADSTTLKMILGWGLPLLAQIVVAVYIWKRSKHTASVFVRAVLRAFSLAVAFTPTVLVGHGVLILPAFAFGVFSIAGAILKEGHGLQMLPMSIIPILVTSGVFLFLYLLVDGIRALFKGPDETSFVRASRFAQSRS